MQLPPDLIDYVLAHEVGHLKEHDHGDPFWRHVERAMPDYTARRARIKRLAPTCGFPDRPDASLIVSRPIMRGLCAPPA
ncbi:hypothetical protein GCM10009735_01750 [Actinomadura chokoriensis]